MASCNGPLFAFKPHCYQYARSNDKLSSVKRAFLGAKREMCGLKMHLPPWCWLAAEMSNNFARPMRSWGYYFNARVGANFVALQWTFDVWRLYFKMEEVSNFQLFSSQNSHLDNEQLDEIGQKPQAKNTKRATEWGIEKFDKWCESKRVQRTWVKFYESSSLKWKALTPSVLTGVRAAIHYHLTCAPFSRNINIFQDSEFISANKIAKAKLFTKQWETKT